MFLDMHGHSVKYNLFLYGCPPREGREGRGGGFVGGGGRVREAAFSSLSLYPSLPHPYCNSSAEGGSNTPV